MVHVMLRARDSSLLPRLACLHTGLVALALLVTIAAPPADGAMLVIPLQSQRIGQVVDWTITAGGTILAAGPIRGSLIIYGHRARMIPAAFANGSVVIAAPASICGAKAALS